ncbi:protein s-acyltransferase 18 [Phtheirospermum japonicum]|uniref:S-acyltransferase n=1 Tax=Phtheirospermum japonicum TaxID=374723 RepID=A0A830BZH0_9LAMI|nr:protein s-acyltransferase 18 [Phtheirospermum japonicum]
MSIATRRHGWQRPLHPLQIVGILVFCFLVAAFYCFIGLFLGSRIAEITVNTVFSFSALSVGVLFIRCAATDPSDKIRFRFRKKKKQKGTNSILKLNYGYIFSRILLRFFKRIERKILRTCIRRKYLVDPWNSRIQIEPLIPFPLVLDDDDHSLAPDPKDDDVSFCSLCDFEVNRHSKHCRTCNRCVEGFDHHCRWLNNCVGKKNYTTFILLMIFVLIMLVVEGGAAIAVFVRCFADRNGIQHELYRIHYVHFPRGLLAALSVLLFLLTTYSTAALGQLFFFHVLLIRKGISTYDYILAMKEASFSMELESTFEDSSSDFSSSDDDDYDTTIDLDSPQKPASFISRIICKDGETLQNPQKLAIRIDGEKNEKPSGFRASIDPWKLINLSREKVLIAADKAREKLAVKHKETTSDDSMKPLPLETRSGPLIMKPDKDLTASKGLDLTPAAAITKGVMVLSSPRRRLSCSPTIHQQQQANVVPSPKQSRYRSDFDLKLTQVSRELETYISKQVLCSVLKNEGREASPR